MIRDRPSDKAWYETRAGVGMMLLYVALTFGGFLLTLGVGSLVPAAYQVPGYVYMFTTLGVMGYVFTMLITDFERRPRELFKAGVRLPAALLLAIGVYLLSSLLTTLLGVSEVAGPVVAGMTFLVGLYVNLTYKQLGAFARKLYPGKPKSSGGDGQRGRQNNSASGATTKTVEIAGDQMRTLENNNSNDNSNTNKNDDGGDNNTCKDESGEGSGSDANTDQDNDHDGTGGDNAGGCAGDGVERPSGPDSPGSDGFEKQAVMDSAVSLGEAVSGLVGGRGRIPAAFHALGATMNDVVREQREADRVVTGFEAATDAVTAAKRTSSTRVEESERNLETVIEATRKLNDAAAAAVGADDWDPETFEALGQELDEIGRQLCTVARDDIQTRDNDIDSAAVVRATDDLGETVADQVGGEARQCITESFHALGDRLSDVLHNQNEADAVVEALQNANEAVTNATRSESGDGSRNN